MSKKEMTKRKLIKYLIIIVVITLAGLIVWNMFPYLKNIHTRDGQIAFKEEIQGMGIKGGLLLFSLQMLQILVAILPR
jgi:hypothetical protein